MHGCLRGTQVNPNFTCFTSTNVQILTLTRLPGEGGAGKSKVGAVDGGDVAGGAAGGGGAGVVGGAGAVGAAGGGGACAVTALPNIKRQMQV